MIASRILYRIADVDAPERDVARRAGPAGGGWDVFILNGRARRWSSGEGAGAFSIKWMAEGRSRYEVERRTRTVSRDAVMLVDHGQPYALEFETRAGAQSFCLFFDEALVRQAWASQEAGFDEAPEEGALRGFPNLAFQPSPKLARLLAAIADAGPEATEIALESRALLALGEAVAAAHRHRGLAARAPAAKASTRAHLLASLERARAMVEADADADLARLAREAGLSRFHFLRLFRAVYGATPMAYAQQVRLDRAAAALRGGDRPIGDIAAEAGYESPSAFAKAFRRRTGASPTAWRT